MSVLTSPLGITAIILIIVGIIMAIVGVIFVISYQNTTKPWWVWGLLIGGIVLGLIGVIILGIALYTAPVAVTVTTPTAVSPATVTTTTPAPVVVAQAPPTYSTPMNNVARTVTLDTYKTLPNGQVATLEWNYTTAPGNTVPQVTPAPQPAPTGYCSLGPRSLPNTPTTTTVTYSSAPTVTPATTYTTTPFITAPAYVASPPSAVVTTPSPIITTNI